MTAVVTRELANRPWQVIRATFPLMPDELPMPESEPNSTRLFCPVCHGIVLPLPGSSAVRALEGHLERDHWYPSQLAHEAASEASNRVIGQLTNVLVGD